MYKKQCLSGVIIPLVFLGVGLFTSMWYFSYNSYPIDYELIDSFEWATLFKNWYMVFSGVCIVFNAIVIPLFGAKLNIHSQHAWLVYLILSILISSIGPMYLQINYPEDSSCTVIMFSLFVLEYLVTFVWSTAVSPRHWNFSPIYDLIRMKNHK